MNPASAYPTDRIPAKYNVIGGTDFTGLIYRVMKADFEVQASLVDYEMVYGRKYDLGQDLSTTDPDKIDGTTVSCPVD